MAAITQGEAAGDGTAPSVDVRTITRKMALGGVIGVIFFSVSGGPYGLEDTIGESGAGLGLILILVVPIIWSLPTSLMVAELATMMPVQGGYYQWVKTALGPFWGFMVAWWAWVASWVDLAIYPVLFVDFAAYFVPDLGTNAWMRWLVCVGVIWGLAGVNMLGASVVGDSSKVFLVIVLAPFVLLTVIGLFHMDQNPFEPFTAGGAPVGPAIGAGLFVIMWKPPGWDVFLDETHAGKMTMLDEMREAYAAALFSLGEDPNTEDPAVIDAATEQLEKMKAVIASFDSATYLDRLRDGKLVAAQGFNTDVLQAKEDNPKLEFVIPEAGGTRWTDLLCIPADAPNPEAANQFIAFYLDPAISAENAEANQVDTGNEAARSQVPSSLLENPAVYPPAEVQKRLVSITSIGAASSRYADGWEQVTG